MEQLTVRAFAKKAGVSRQAASDILNDRYAVRVSEGTRTRVKELARQLNFRPNFFAKSLKQGKTRCIGFMGGSTIVDFRFPYVAHVASALEEEMWHENSPYSLLIFGINKEDFGHTFDMLQKGLVDGVILLTMSVDLDPCLEKVVPLLEKVGIPFVVIHTLTRDFSFNNIGVDMGDGMYRLTTGLADQGYRDIRYYAPGTRSLLEQESVAGYARALKERNPDSPVPPVLIPENRAALAHYRDAAGFARNLKEIPDAIIAASDDQAGGLLKGFTERGLTVPGDVAIACRHASLPNPVHEEITAVLHPVREKCTRALEVLQQIMEGKRKPGELFRKILKPEIRNGITT